MSYEQANAVLSVVVPFCFVVVAVLLAFFVVRAIQDRRETAESRRYSLKSKLAAYAEEERPFHNSMSGLYVVPVRQNGDSAEPIIIR